MKLRPFGGALALAALVAGGGWAVTLHNRHTAAKVAGQPAPTPSLTVAVSPSPSATPLPSPPPPGVDLLWRKAGDDVMQLEARDWSGQVRGGIVLPASTMHLGSVSPSVDGQRLLIAQGFEYSVMTAQGQLVAKIDDPQNKKFVSWSDDDTHLCATTSTSDASADLQLITLGGATRTVTSMRWPGGDGGMQVVACNVATDIAVVSVSLGDDDAGHVVEYKVVRLSSGTVLRDVHPPAPDFSGPEPRPVPGALDLLTASPDGRLLALEPYTGMMDGTPADTAIVEAATGRTFAHLHGTVRAFTGDGKAVLTEKGRIDWRTGRNTGTVPGCCDGSLAGRPHSADVVVSVASGPAPTPNAAGAYPVYPPPNILLLRADGTTLLLACCGASIL